MGDMKAAIARARPIPFGPPLRGPAPDYKPWSWAGELSSWTLAGGLFALAARESRRIGMVAIGWSVLFAGCVSMAIETVQILIPSREVDTTSVVLAVLGSALGAVACRAFGRQIRPPMDQSGPARVGRDRRPLRLDSAQRCLA